MPIAPGTKSLEQLKLDAANTDWGAWCRHWDRNPLDLHPNDERALLGGCWFDLAAANRVHQFYEQYLTLPAHGGGVRPFILYDWWFRDIIGPLFAWKRSDGRRRFTKGFITTGKKSGKSTVLAGLPLYMIEMDGEPEAEAYATAVDRDQASIVFRKTERMVRLSPQLRRRLKITASTKRIFDQELGSWLEAISSDADSADGKNPHLLILDELHRWRDREFYNTLVYGDISRPQPMFLMITTAGNDMDGIGYEEYCYAKDLVDPSTDVYDMSRFAAIYEAGFQKDESGQVLKDEDGRPKRLAWDDPVGWIQANPTILEDDTELRLQRLKENCDEARTSKSKRRNFMRFVPNWWVSDVEDMYIPWDDWVRCAELHDLDPATLAGRACWAGLDLSSLIDITALCLAFRMTPAETKRQKDVVGYRLLWNFWIPEDTIREAEERDRVPYSDWVSEGWIIPIPGRRVEYSYIRREISGVELDEQGTALPIKYIGSATKKYQLQAIAYDPWNSEKLITELSKYDGIKCMEMRQGFVTMSRPAKKLQATFRDGLIDHGGNPVAAWMARNAKIDQDPAGNMKINKKKSRKRIDGITAAVMAVGMAEAAPGISGAWSGKTGTGIFD